MLTNESLREFTGSETLFKHGFFLGVCYTEGVRHVAREGKAYWLLDEIASHLIRMNISPFSQKALHFWKLTVKDNQGVLLARVDSDQKPFFKKELDYTDFPLDEIDIWAAYNEHGWTIYLPSEH